MGTRISPAILCVTLGVIAISPSASAAGAAKPPAQAAGSATGAGGAAAKKTPSPAEALLKRALQHEKEGKLATAWAEYKQVLEEATKSNNKKRLTTARTHLADTFKKLSYFKIDAGPQGNATEVYVDGKLIDKSTWSAPQPFDAGPHEIKVAADGAKTQTFNVTLQPGPVTQSLPLPVLDSNGAAPVPPPAVATTTPDQTPPPASTPPPDDSLAASSSSPPPAKKSGSTARTVGYVVGGVGIVGIGVGTYFGIVAIGNKKDVDANCGAGGSSSLTSSAIPCDAKGFKAEKDAHTNGTISTIGIGVGAAALATGIVLIILTRGSDKEKSALSISPQVPLVGTGGGAVLTGAF